MIRDRNDSSATPARIRMQHYRARQRGENIPLRKPGPRPKAQQAMIPAHPGADRGYALDFHTPVRHVGTVLADAGARGATIAEMADTYRPFPGDLVRVQLHHGLDGELAARRFLIDRAVSALGVQAQRPDGTRGPGQIRESRSLADAVRYRLAVPVEDLRYDGRAVVLVRDDLADDS
jgi:hypothetical protein